MRRYYFHFEGSRPHEDKTGELLPSDAAAWALALRLARDVEHGSQPGEHWSVRVLDGTEPVFLLTMTTKRFR